MNPDSSGSATPTPAGRCRRTWATAFPRSTWASALSPRGSRAASTTPAPGMLTAPSSAGGGTRTDRWVGCGRVGWSGERLFESFESWKEPRGVSVFLFRERRLCIGHSRLCSFFFLFPVFFGCKSTPDLFGSINRETAREPCTAA